MGNKQIVVFSDVQGNGIALDWMFKYLKAFFDFESLTFICLGDVACGYAPNTVLDLLRENQVRCITGNMDEVVLNPQKYHGNNEDEKRYSEMDIWAYEQLTPINRDFLADSRKNIIETHLPAYQYLFGHGSYWDNTIALNHDMPEAELLEHMEDGQHKIQFTGHTHKQFMIPVGDKILINPGSVGFPDPLTNGKRPLRVQFATVLYERVEFITLVYKREDFTFAVMNSGMPHAIWYLSQWNI